MSASTLQFSESMGRLSRAGSKPDLRGYLEEEQVAMAQERLAANRQHRRMKQLLGAASTDGMSVSTKDLLLSAKLAKMDLPDALVANTPYAMSKDAFGVPTRIAYKPFYSQLPYPELKPSGSFGELPMLRRNRPQDVAIVADEVVEVKKVDEPGPEEVAYYFKLIQTKMKDRFAQVQRAFRKLDQDASGELDVHEFNQMLNMFNLGHVPPAVVDKIRQLTDFDGDGKINFAEFARLITTSDVNNMKKTLSAMDDGGAAAKVNFAMQHGANVDKETGVNVKLRRTGPGLAKMRRFHEMLRKLLESEFGDLSNPKTIKAIFSKIDADGSGLVRRKELRTFLKQYSKTTSDQIISGIIDYVDTDGDVRTLSFDEFSKMMQADYLK